MPLHTPGDLLNPGIQPASLAGRLFITEPPGKPEVDYYTAIKKNEIIPVAATWMDPEMIIVRHTEKGKYHTISLICGIWVFFLKYTNELIFKTERDSQI